MKRVSSVSMNKCKHSTMQLLSLVISLRVREGRVNLGLGPYKFNLMKMCRLLGRLIIYMVRLIQMTVASCCR